MRTCLVFVALVSLSFAARAQAPVNADSSLWQGTDSLELVDHAVKIDPIQVVFGDITLYLERAVSNHFSVEAGIGFTRRNYFVGLSDYSADNIARNVKIKSGIILKGGVRYYIRNTPELNGIYLMPFYAYRHYISTFNELTTTGDYNGISHDDDRKISDAGLIIGDQLLGATSNFFIDVYLGGSFRHKNFMVVKRDNTLPGEVFYTRPFHENTIGLVFGLKVGYGF